MPWMPPKPDAATALRIKQELAWSEEGHNGFLGERLKQIGENLEKIYGKTKRPEQRFYHVLTLPVMRRLLMWYGSRDGRFLGKYMFWMSCAYWDYVGEYPDGDLLLAKRQTTEAAIIDRSEHQLHEKRDYARHQDDA